MNEPMNDRNVMENLLLLEKGACDLYMHGAIEASDERVFSSFSSALHQSLQLQNQIYTKMKEKYDDMLSEPHQIFIRILKRYQKQH